MHPELKEKVIAAVQAGHSYGEVARKLGQGLTRSAVGGVAYRAKQPVKPWRQRPLQVTVLGSKYDEKIIALLADKRPRTTSEIIARVGGTEGGVYSALRALRRLGMVVMLPGRPHGHRVWQEADDV